MPERITVISHWHNEELLAPLFLRHYRHVDKIHILLDSETNDRTREILSGQPNVVITEFTNQYKNDAYEILDNYKWAISEVKDGWIYLVDADEFIFPENFEDDRAFLQRQTADVVCATLFHVYRHNTDSDIDYTKDPVPQRIHALDGGREFKNWFRKPDVFRASCDYIPTIGGHTRLGNITYSTERYIGAHWKHADMEIAIKRRLSNRDMMSPRNRRKGYCNHEFHITEERIREMLTSKSNLPVLPHLVNNAAA
ncbi:MAG: glycosyltransferase family 2 protein [Gammaproteobacteria bacterium]|nr:glycosyltransferase family 2 protein [Gammaproteobacteria bacterium]